MKGRCGMRILALDQKTSGAGWCIAEDDRYINSGYYKTVGKDGWDKITDFGRWLSLIDKDSADVIILEYPSGNSGNMDTNLKLGAVLYECISVARANGIDVVIVKPSEVKATGIYKGQLESAGKYKQFGILKKKDGTINKAAMGRQDDEIDAIGIWLAGLKRIREND
jgi:hypothetical protein